MTAAWADGYTTDLPYLPTYHRAQAPASMQLACALAGVHVALPRDRLAFLDIGCGRGMATLAMAAANPGWTVVGIDYMPAHIAEAREIAAAAGLGNVRFLEEDVAALDEARAQRLLPEFDVVTLHGLWTWVSPAVREGILRLARARLRPGGLLMATYNSMPGWAEDQTLRRLVQEVVPRLEGPLDARVMQALEMAQGLRKAGAPTLARSFFLGRLDTARPASREAFARYAMHEFLPEHASAAYPQDVAEAFAEAKLQPVGSMKLGAHFAELSLGDEQRGALAALPRGIDREFAIDLFARPTLRADLFVRGRRPADVASTLAPLMLGLCWLPRTGKAPLTTPTGRAELPDPVVEAAFAALARGPQSIAALAALPAMGDTTAIEIAAVLAGSNVAAPVWDPAPTEAARLRAMRFNRVLLESFGAAAAAAGGDLAVAVPMLGAALPIKPVELATLLALDGSPGGPGGVEQDVPTIARGILAPGATAEAAAWTEGVVDEALAELAPAWRALGLLR